MSTIMTTDTQNRDPASIEVLDEVNLEAVIGGLDALGSINAAVGRATRAYLFNTALAGYMAGAVYKELGPCP